MESATDLFDDEDAVATALSRAIDDGSIRTHYQPKLDLRDGHVVGVEALARWYEPGVGHVGPQQFVPVAERAGLMLDLTHRVLEDVAAANRRASLRGTKVPLAVNVSAATVNDELVAVLYGALEVGELDHGQLTVELTETTLFANSDAARRSLQRLHRRGIQLSIDDFGIGWSSLGYLAELPVAELKIDRSFVQRLESSYEVRCIVHRTIELARDLGVKVVAEGVETEGQRRALLELGCVHAQGYLMARPMPELALWHWLEQGDRLADPSCTRRRRIPSTVGG